MTSAIETTSDVYRLLKNMGVTPRGVQLAAIESGLLEGRSIMVCSPTGSGKTLVGEMGLLRAVTDGSRGLYLVPLRALAGQVFTLLHDHYSDQGYSVGISTGDYQDDGQDLAEYDIVVTTYERGDSLLRHNAEWLRGVGCIVIDEIQTLGEGLRGARLEGLIMRMRRLVENLQIVALSATVGSPEALAQWLGCRLIFNTERPVPLKYSVVPTNDRDRTIRDLTMTTVQHNGQVIVFFRTRKECETQALRLAAHVKRQMTANEKTAVDAELTSVENWDASLPSEITPLLHDGVGYHHAGLSSRGRAMVESLFRRGMIRALCATTTLAAGMDLPARLVIVSSVHSPSDYRQMLPVNMVHQMLGRAGRPGRDEQGFGVIVAGSRGEADAIVEHYFYHTGDDSTGRTLLEPRYAPVHSALGTSAALTEQLLAFLDHMQGSTLEHMQDEVLADSYYTYSRRGISRTPMRHLELGVLTASAAIELHALSDTVHAARQGSVGTVRIREVGEDVIGGIVAEQMSGQFTCRFSARLSSGNIVEGPMCSCGRGLDEDGILCQHLVALGIEASTQLGSLADYVIPLALSESSPFEALSRLGLIEGTSDGRVAPTRLGRTVNRLYLRIQTAREMLAMLPLVDSNMQMMALLKHLMFVESGQEQDTLVDAVIGHVVNTSASLADIARTLEQSAGDVFALLERFRWLLHSTAAVAEVGGMTHVCELARQLYNIIDSRFVTKEVITDGDQ